ncbi:MAG: TonB family protein [Thermodesulfovibrionales bacterium]|jgi:colicin import membrane protein
MSAVSLQRTAALSLLLHISLFAATLLAVRHSTHFVMPSPYMVDLVSPEAFANKTAEKSLPESKESLPAEKSRLERKADMSAPKTLRRSDEKLIEERIEALKQTEKDKTIVEKRIEALKQTEKNEKIVEKRLSTLKEIENIKRNLKLGEIISVKKENTEAKIGPATGAAGQGKGSVIDDYGRLVGEEIRRQWQFPTDLLDNRNIEAIVLIRVQKNGSVQILHIEKSSGNPLFDRSALRAITKASPVTSPPYEMEIGVRFYP